MPGSEDFRTALLAAVPQLRAYARSLCRNQDQADDLVQEALLSAWQMQQSLREIERLKPWLLAILRNAFLHKKRKTRREVEDPDGLMSAQLAVAAPQDSTVEFLDVLAALDRIPADQREALVLVYVDQVSYEEAAAIAGCPIGTLKSRVNRGRKSLHSELGQSASRDIRSNTAMHAVIAEPIRTTRRS